MNETAIFQQFLADKNLKHSQKRDWILEIFLRIEKHLTAEDLWSAVRKKHPSVGFATVYRTMKLLCKSGMCRELIFEDGTTRYEHKYGHEHHDHLICTECGRCLEVVDAPHETSRIFPAISSHGPVWGLQKMQGPAFPAFQRVAHGHRTFKEFTFP